VAAVLWQFEKEPTEPFFTDLILIRDGIEVHREEHVAYPAALWEPGDWQRLRMLNLFDLPPAIDIGSITEIRLEHRGILSGRRVIPAATVRLSD
jgi:hypothetical protein